MRDQSSIPARYADIVDLVMKQDHEYFDEHPEKEIRVRPYSDGEFWPFKFPADMQVIVESIDSGVRSRMPTQSPIGIYPGKQARQFAMQRLGDLPDGLAPASLEVLEEISTAIDDLE